MSITIRYGIDSITRDFPAGATFRQVINNSNVKAGLGFGDNVKVTVQGTEMPLDAVASTSFVVETAANTKATV